MIHTSGHRKQKLVNLKENHANVIGEFLDPYLLLFSIVLFFLFEDAFWFDIY